MKKNTTTILAISTIILSGCYSSKNPPLIFCVSIGTSTTDPGADLTVGYKDANSLCNSRRRNYYRLRSKRHRCKWSYGNRRHVFRRVDLASSRIPRQARQHAKHAKHAKHAQARRQPSTPAFAGKIALRPNLVFELRSVIHRKIYYNS